MEIRECTADDVVSLLQIARDDKETKVFDDWAAYQKWLLDAAYRNDYHVIVADDGNGVVGFLVWQLFESYGKIVGFLNTMFVLPDFRKTGVADDMVWKFIDDVYNSPADMARWETRWMSKEYYELISKYVPMETATTYIIRRDENLKEWYESLKEA